MLSYKVGYWIINFCVAYARGGAITKRLVSYILVLLWFWVGRLNFAISSNKKWRRCVVCRLKNLPILCDKTNIYCTIWLIWSKIYSRKACHGIIQTCSNLKCAELSCGNFCTVLGIPSLVGEHFWKREATLALSLMNFLTHELSLGQTRPSGALLGRACY